MFTTMVHNNQSLDDVTKFQYLKLALRGDAARQLSSITVTNANYRKAWEMLQARFSHERVMVFAHLERLFDQPPLQHESSFGLRKLIDNTNESVRALENLARETSHWGDILVYFTMLKLDPETRRRLELSLPDKKVPTFDRLMELLEQQSIALDTMSPSKFKGKPAHHQQQMKPMNLHRPDKGNQVNANPKAHLAAAQGKNTCLFCKETHSIFQCQTFIGKSVPDRIQLAKELKLCLNCLRTGHFATNCPSTSSCRTCNKRHHSLLHQVCNVEAASVVSHLSKPTEPVSQVLLATAVIAVKDSHGSLQPCRVLLDNGSQASFITSAFVNKLGLKRNDAQCGVSGIAGSEVAKSNCQVSIQVASRLEADFALVVNALVLQQVTGHLPNFSCNPTQWKHLSGLRLADPMFHKPQGVDLLLGADVFSAIVRGNFVRGPDGSPTAQETACGWIVFGPADVSTEKKVVAHFGHINLDATLQKFWELEDVSSERQLTSEEKDCEKHFAETHLQKSDGRYVVRLPFKEPSEKTLGNSYDAALRRFKQLERRLTADSDLHKGYSAFMNEYLAMGHMELVPDNELSNPSSHCFYLPHHPVIKDDSTTTKLRVVFDASAKTTHGTSLNDLLMVGPTLQDDLVTLLVRFRSHQIALKADLEKMFRFIELDKRDRDFFRIFWRERSTDPLLVYRLTTVTFGSACAPYQAIKTVQQLANDEKTNFPKACEIIRRDLYVDDLMSGESSDHQAIKLQKLMMSVMRAGGFNLRKWSSNNSKVLAAIPADLRETQLPLQMDSDESVKTLGLRWHPAVDRFSFSVEPFKFQTLTKRIILSDIAKIFDPLGFLSPVTISAKILMQQLWKLQLGWDESLLQRVQDEWYTYRLALRSIQEVQIDRLIAKANPRSFQLHGFSDASERAFAAVVYLRTVTTTGQVTLNLVSAKTKVAPLRQVSLPRLELCGAVLLSKLMKTVKNALPLHFELCCGWIDSTVALHWISAPPQRWKTFVANRVTEVQESIHPGNWFHVPGVLNPADSASRGIPPEQLRSHPLWWNGPPFLRDLNWTRPTQEIAPTEEASAEERKICSSHVVQSDVMQPILQRFSSLSKLTRATALWARFYKSLHSTDPNASPISADETEFAKLKWIRYVQRQEFALEYKALSKNEQCPIKSKILSLAPLMDSHQVIRVGGRLQNSDLEFDRKHPILLPQHHHLTKLIVSSYDERLLHAGPQLLLHSLQQTFWIPRGKDVARACIRKCITCFRQNADVQQQLMGNLPKSRVVPSPAFYICGVDYAGPFLLKPMKSRNPKCYKAYIAVFVCFTTRAIHLELVSDLSTDAFIAALKRFIGRRSMPSVIHSDCGTNFVGAARELKEFLALVRSEDATKQISSVLQRDGVNWHFNPPASPHFGGLWEAGVKSTKHHLKRVLGNTPLTYEEFSTLLIQIEACLNSRPLFPLSASPDDLSALTPGHFLVGRPLISLAEPNYTKLKVNRLSRWQLLQQLYQHFWRRWQMEYLSRLQQRPKWAKVEDNLRQGDLVLVKDDRLPPQEWRLGRVLEVHAGADGLVRVVTLRTADGMYKRPVAKLCNLPLDSRSDATGTTSSSSATGIVENNISTRAGMLRQTLLSAYVGSVQTENVGSHATNNTAEVSDDSSPHLVGESCGFSSSREHAVEANGSTIARPALLSTSQCHQDSQTTDRVSGPLELPTVVPE